MPRSAPRFHPMDQSRLYKVRTRPKLAALFGLDRKGLDAVLSMDRPYSERDIQVTRNGKTKTRRIQEPRGALRPIHEAVQRMLSRIEPPGFLFCPVKRRSYVGNAARHAGAGEIRTLDIKDYFPSTPRHRVYWFFHTVMRCEPDVASILAELLTVNGHLATGSTVSPILSFFAFHDMWHAVARMVEEAGCKLSVYIDDATISGDAVPERLVWRVRQRIHGSGLVYHKEKRFAGGVGEVTGVLVGNGELRVPNRQHKKAHDARTRLAETASPDEAALLSSTLHGLAEQRRQVEAGHLAT